MTPPIVCFGEILLRLSAPGKELLLQSPAFAAHVGGAEANVAVALSRLGHRTHVVSALPESALGRACAGELRRHGVDTEAIQFRDGRMGLYFMTHGAGQRASEVLYDRQHSAFACAQPSAFDWSTLLQGAAWLHMSGITPAVSATAAHAALAAAKTARRLGVSVSFDCNFRARVWCDRTPEAPRLLRGLCEQADLLFGDERDIAFMLGAPPASAVKAQSAARAAFAAFEHLRFMACTERSADAHYTGFLHTRNESVSSRAYALQGVVDRIGAGDAFAAGLLHSLVSGVDAQRAIEFATASGCLKHSIPGDFNLVNIADIELLLSDQPIDVRR